MIKTAMVMAAGHGTRMRPLTDNTCKALVVVDGKTLINHMLDRLHTAGIERAIVNVHAFADQLEAHLKARTGGPKIIISNERDALLETGGGVVKALPLLGTAPVLICNIDAVWIEFAPVLSQLMQAWDGRIMDELFLLAPINDTLGYAGAGDFDLAGDGKVSRRTGDEADYVYAGVEIFKPKLARGFPQEKFSRTKIWDTVFAKQRAYGHVLAGFWMHVGDPEAVGFARAVLKEAR
ncbi:MAG: mannose-1-phosphate guanylyltransferase [Robiginitomaculum sp.]|nr:MAG: mannose-1-phosphate guanylyltransferase [Robiginitomaculum sp.]